METIDMTLLSQIPIFDKDFYESNKIRILNDAFKVIKDARIKATVLRKKPGLARLMNLATWRSDGAHEYLDQPEIAGDVILHVACHQAIHQRFGSDRIADQLLGEAIASASDLYLVGLFAKAGVEPPFLEETLESYTFYYESYGQISQLERLLEQTMDQPSTFTAALARYLFEFAACFLSDSPESSLISSLADHDFYPLVHHYHLTNWVLNLKRQTIESSISVPSDTWEKLASENGLASLLNLNHPW